MLGYGPIKRSKFGLERRRCTRAAVACGLLRREIFFAQPVQTPARNTVGLS